MASRLALARALLKAAPEPKGAEISPISFPTPVLGFSEGPPRKKSHPGKVMINKTNNTFLKRIGFLLRKTNVITSKNSANCLPAERERERERERNCLNIS